MSEQSLLDAVAAYWRRLQIANSTEQLGSAFMMPFASVALREATETQDVTTPEGRSELAYAVYEAWRCLQSLPPSEGLDAVMERFFDAIYAVAQQSATEWRDWVERLFSEMARASRFIMEFSVDHPSGGRIIEDYEKTLPSVFVMHTIESLIILLLCADLSAENAFLEMARRALKTAIRTFEAAGVPANEMLLELSNELD